MNKNKRTNGIVASMQGKLIYLLIIVAITQFIYPMTVDNPLALLAYQVLYALQMIAGIMLVRESRFQSRLLMVLGGLWLATSIIYILNVDALWALTIGYIVIGLFQGAIVYVLINYIFRTKEVDLDVIYAACTIYLLLGAVFVPIYGLIETTTFVQTGMHAFADPNVAPDEIFPWQSLVYYSYATLTTLGYGDVLPVSYWARSVASVEAILGVLYTTVIVARLVGLYATREIEQDLFDSSEENSS